MDCPNCNVDMEIIDYEEDTTLSWSEISRTWHYKCPYCGKTYIETYTYKCTERHIEEE